MATQQQHQQQQQPRFVTPRFYRQYNQRNRPAVPPKAAPSSPHSRSRSSTFSRSSDTGTSTNAQLQPPSAHQRSVSMTSPSSTSSTSSTETSSTSTNTKSAPTRPALSLILPGSQTLTPPDSRSPSHSHLRSSSYTIGQTQGNFPPKSQPQRTISETLHTRNTTVPSIITTPVSPTDGDRSPGDTRTSRSNTSDGPKPAATASARPRGPSLSALQAVTRETPLNSHPRTPESTPGTATADSPPETADAPEQVGPSPSAVNTESKLKSQPVEPESSENPRTTTKQAPPLPSESQPTPEQETMTPVADLLRSRPSQTFSDNTTTGGTNSPYQNASTQPRSSVAIPAAVRSSMPEPPTQSHVQIRNSRLSFTNLKSNLSLNTLLQSQPSGYQASAPTAPSQSSTSTTSASTGPSTFSPQPQTLSTPLSPPPQPTPGPPQFQPPNPNPDPNPHDASSLLALTHHVHTQTSQARHLFAQFQHYLPFVEKQWIQSTIGDTEAAARDILLLTESMRIDQETNNGKLGLKTQFRWMMRDSRRARERRERLVLCHASLVAVLVRLEGVRAKVPETALPEPSFGNPGAGVGAGVGVGSVPVAPVEISASSPALQTEFEHELPIQKSTPPVLAPPPPTKPTTTAATAEANASAHTNSQAYPPPPTAAPPPIPFQAPVQNNNKPDSPTWDLPVQLQDADKELVVNHAQPPPVPPKVKIEEDANPTSTASATAAAGNGTANNNPTNGSIVSGAGTETETETATTTATGTPRTMSPVSPEGPTKLDNELLDMLEWRWNQGRAA